jgi:hypothetical protein
VSTRVGLPIHTTTFGIYLPFLALLLAAWLWIQLIPTLLHPYYPRHGFALAQLNCSLFVLLLVAYLTWLVLYLRSDVTPATGSGLPLSAYGLSLRLLADMQEFFLPEYGREHLPDEPVFGVLDAARGLGFIAFVAGLSFVVAACLAERRLRREAPDWAIPP